MSVRPQAEQGRVWHASQIEVKVLTVTPERAVMKVFRTNDLFPGQLVYLQTILSTIPTISDRNNYQDYSEAISNLHPHCIFIFKQRRYQNQKPMPKLNLEFKSGVLILFLDILF